MVTATPNAPARPCDQGHTGQWRQLRSGGWECATCARTPAEPTDDNGLPLLARHVCDRLGCSLTADDDDDPAPASFVTVATVTIAGPCLIRCTCRRFVRVLLVDAAGIMACAACAALSHQASGR